MNINPIQQRSGDTLLVSSHCRVGTGTSLLQVNVTITWTHKIAFQIRIITPNNKNDHSFLERNYLARESFVLVNTLANLLL